MSRGQDGAITRRGSSSAGETSPEDISARISRLPPEYDHHRRERREGNTRRDPDPEPIAASEEAVEQ